MLNYACDNCKHSAVHAGEAPCVNCIPHSEGWSGFEAHDVVVPRSVEDIMNDLVRKVSEVNKLVVELNQHIK